MIVTKKERRLADSLKPKKAEKNQSKDLSVDGNNRSLVWKRGGQSFSGKIIRMYPGGKFLVRLDGKDITIRTERVPEWKDLGQNESVADSYAIM